MSAVADRVQLKSKPIVLVVDDLDSVRELLNAALRREGFDVRLASGGRLAVELYRYEHHSIDLVLLDVQMPEMDGPEVLTAIREIEPHVCAFFMTGDPGGYTQDGLLANGAHGVFAKPFDIAKVTSELRRSLSSKGVLREVPANGHVQS